MKGGSELPDHGATRFYICRGKDCCVLVLGGYCILHGHHGLACFSRFAMTVSVLDEPLLNATSL